MDHMVHLPADRRTRGKTLAAIAAQASTAIRHPSEAWRGDGHREVSAAAGPLGDVLEAARMIWQERWRVEELSAAGSSTLTLSVPTDE